MNGRSRTSGPVALFKVEDWDVAGIHDFDGDGNDDIAGLNSTGQIYYTTDLSTWTNIPGTFTAIATGDLDGDGDVDGFDLMAYIMDSRGLGLDVFSMDFGEIY